MTQHGKQATSRKQGGAPPPGCHAGHCACPAIHPATTYPTCDRAPSASCWRSRLVVLVGSVAALSAGDHRERRADRPDRRPLHGGLGLVGDRAGGGGHPGPLEFPRRAGDPGPDPGRGPRLHGRRVAGAGLAGRGALPCAIRSCSRMARQPFPSRKRPSSPSGSCASSSPSRRLARSSSPRACSASARSGWRCGTALHLDLVVLQRRPRPGGELPVGRRVLPTRSLFYVTSFVLIQAGALSF